MWQLDVTAVGHFATSPATNILCLLASILYIFLFFYSDQQPSNKVLSSNSVEVVRVEKKQNQNIPTVTHWFPFQVPLVDGILTLLTVRNLGVTCMEKWQSKFGKVYWLPFGPKKVFMMNDVDMIKKLLSSNNPQHLNKPNEFTDKIFNRWVRDGLVNSKFALWSSHRKMLKHCFTYSCLQKNLESMNKHGRDLTKSLSCAISKKNASDQTKDTDFINETIHYHLIKIITDIVMGTANLTDDVAINFAKTFNVYKEAMMESLLNPLVDISLFRYFNTKITNQLKAMEHMDTFFNDILNKYRKEHEQELSRAEQTNQNIIDVDTEIKPFRCIIEEMLCQGASNKEIIDEVATFIFGGHDTTLVSLQMLLLHMALNPIHQSRCRDEVDKLICEKASVSNQNAEEFFNNFEFTMSDLSNLKYLERCILESMRITPTIPAFMRKVDSPLQLSNDLELASGTVVVIPVWMVHRDPDTYSNPVKFDPDRFLPENVKKRHPYSYIPFSAGPRNCIGYKMALMEIKVIMAMILRSFEICSNDKLEDVKLFFEVTLKLERNYNIILKRRQL